jgi:hypothetical protein
METNEVYRERGKGMNGIKELNNRCERNVQM